MEAVPSPRRARHDQPRMVGIHCHVLSHAPQNHSALPLLGLTCHVAPMSALVACTSFRTLLFALHPRASEAPVFRSQAPGPSSSPGSSHLLPQTYRSSPALAAPGLSTSLQTHPRATRRSCRHGSLQRWLLHRRAHALSSPCPMQVGSSCSAPTRHRLSATKLTAAIASHLNMRES